MKTDRRTFIKNVGIGGIGAAVLAGTKGDAASQKLEKYGVLVDVRKCVGCKACQIACKLWNGNEPDPHTSKDDFSPSTWCWVQDCKHTDPYPDASFYTMKRQCMHCDHPACIEACPQEGEAIHKEANEVVVINHDKCIRCESCIEACPYGVPKLDESANLVKKCVFCMDRIQNGMAPACVDTCPTSALTFGSLDEVNELGKKIRKKGYPVHGLKKDEWSASWVYVFPKDVQHKPMFFIKS